MTIQPPPLTDRAAAVAHLRAIFGNAPAGYYFCIWTLYDGPAGERKITCWYPTGDLAVIDQAGDQAIEMAHRGFNVYTGPYLCAEDLGGYRRGSESEVAALLGFCGDVDVAHDAHSKTTLPSDEETARQIVQGTGVEPTVITWSGHGLQTMMLLQEPWKLDCDEDRQRAKDLSLRYQAAIKRSAAALGYDVDMVGDLVRVLRVQGTINAKLHKITRAPFPPTPVLSRTVDGPRWQPDKLATVLPAVEEHRARPMVSNAPTPVPLGLADAEVIDRAMKAANGARFAALWNGNSGRNPSSADLALSNHLAFWTGGDAVQIDRLFRSSGLMRDKWDERHYASGQTYGEHTIAVALEGRTEFYTPGSILRAAPARNGHQNGHAATADIPPASAANGAADDDDGDDDDDTNTEAPVSVTCLSDFAPVVNRQLNRKASRAAKQRVAKMIGDWLIARGRLLLDTDETSEPSVYLLSDAGAALPLTDKLIALRSELARAGLNPTETAFLWLVAYLQTRAVNGEGRRVRLARWITQRDGTLYISSGPAHMVKARDGQPLERVSNGTDDVLFADDAVLPAWMPADPLDPIGLAAFGPRLEAPAELPQYTPERQRLLFRAWLVALLMGIRPLPLLTAIGNRDSGKSTSQRATVKLLLGPAANVTDTAYDQRDFAALVTGRPYVALDNMDGQPEKWLLDVLAQAVTGGSADRRQYYTLDRLASRPITAALSVTTRTACFASRPDILDRLLPLFAAPLADGARKADRVLMDQVNAFRDNVLSWLALAAAGGWAHIEDTPMGLPSRFADYAAVVWHLDPQNCGAALNAMVAAQALSVSDPDPLAEAVLTHLPAAGLHGNPAAIIKQLLEDGATVPYMGGGKAIARRLRELRPLVARAGVSMEEERIGEHTTWHITRTGT